MSDPSPIARLRPKKAFGQNFLVNEGAIATIVGSALASRAPRLLEIGPGPGVLTERLLADGRPLWAVDLDPEACALLRERFSTRPHFHLLQGDAVRIPLPEGEPWSVVGNLPYNAATPILARLLTEGLAWERMVLMFQLEVAQKLMGLPGTKAYGPLSVLAQLCATLTRLVKLGRVPSVPRPRWIRPWCCSSPGRIRPASPSAPLCLLCFTAPSPIAGRPSPTTGRGFCRREF